MRLNFFSLASLVTFVFFNSIIADDSNTTCPQDYNVGTELFQCGPGNPPCVSLLNEGRFNNFPNTPLNCDESNKICQYPNDSILSVVCPQGTIDIYWATDNSTFISNANNIFAYYLSNQCSQNPYSINSTQNGDTLVVDCDPLKNSNGSPCTNDYNYNRNITTAQPAFECGLDKADCVTLEGNGGVLIQSPNKADACDPFDRFCSFPHYSELTVQCDQGTITAQFAGTQNTFQNHAPNSIAYWMSNKCTGPSNSLSTQDGDLLVVNCDPFFPFGPTN